MPKTYGAVRARITTVTIDGLDVLVDHEGHLFTRATRKRFPAANTVAELRRQVEQIEAEAEARRIARAAERAAAKQQPAAAAPEPDAPPRPVAKKKTTTARLTSTFERVTVRGVHSSQYDTALITLADGTKTTEKLGNLLTDLDDDDPRLDWLRRLHKETQETRDAQRDTEGRSIQHVLGGLPRATANLDPASGRFVVTLEDGQTFTGDSLAEVDRDVAIYRLRDTPWTLSSSTRDDKAEPVMLGFTDFTRWSNVWPTREAVEAHLYAKDVAEATARAFSAHKAAAKFDASALT